MADNDDILEELEEGLNKIDEEFERMENQANKTRRKAKSSFKDLYNKGNEWILSNLVAVMFFIVAMTALVLYLNPALPKFEIEKVKEVISVPAKAITEKQEPNLLILNKDNFIVTRTRVTTSRITDKELFIIYMKNKEDNIFLTLIKNVDSLNDSEQKLYTNFVKAEQAKILKESK